LVGLKTSRGRVAMDPPDHWYGLSVAGCVSRGVLDSALWLDAVAAQRPERPFVESAGTLPGKLRIALSAKPGVLGVRVKDSVRTAVDEAAQVRRSLGPEVAERAPATADLGRRRAGRGPARRPVRRRGDAPVARGAARGGDRLAGSPPARGLRPAPGNLRAAVFLTPRPPYQAQLGQRRRRAQAALSRCCAGLLSPGDPKDSTVRGEFGASATLDELRPI